MSVKVFVSDAKKTKIIQIISTLNVYKRLGTEYLQRADDAGGITGHYGAGRNVAGDDASGAYYGSFTDGYSGKDGYIAPSQTLSPMVMGRAFSVPLLRSWASSGWTAVSRLQPGPMKTWLPMVTGASSRTVRLKLM